MGTIDSLEEDTMIDVLSAQEYQSMVTFDKSSQAAKTTATSPNNRSLFLKNKQQSEKDLKSIMKRGITIVDN